MKEYRIVCDRGVVYTDGEIVTSNGVDVGVPPTTHNVIASYERRTWNDKQTANEALRHAQRHCPEVVVDGCKRTYQYNFRIQSREVTDWRDEK